MSRFLLWRGRPPRDHALVSLRIGVFLIWPLVQRLIRSIRPRSPREERASRRRSLTPRRCPSRRDRAIQRKDATADDMLCSSWQKPAIAASRILVAGRIRVFRSGLARLAYRRAPRVGRGYTCVDHVAGPQRASHSASAHHYRRAPLRAPSDGRPDASPP